MATALPADSDFIGAAITEDQYKAAKAQELAYLRGLLGDDGSAATARQNLGLSALTLNYNDRGTWATATVYSTNDQVINNGIAYLCVQSHTSVTFANDQASGYWVVLQGLDNISGLESIADIAALRTITPTARRVSLAYHTSRQYGGGGVFYGVTGGLPGQYTDNNGTVIVPTGGDGSAAWLRERTNNVLDAAQFGVMVDGVTDNTTNVQRFINAAKSGDVLTMRGGICLCDDLVFTAPAGGLSGVTLDWPGVTLRRISTAYDTANPTHNYALTFIGYDHLTVKGIIFDRLNSTINIGGMNGVLLTDCVDVNVVECDFTECFWGVVSSGPLSVRHTVMRCTSNFQSAYSATADTNRTFCEFIYRTFGDASGSNHSHAAVQCSSIGSAMIFQPHLSPHSMALYNYSENCWSSAIYMASDHCQVIGNTVKSAGKDGIKVNALFDARAVLGGIISGNYVNGCGRIRTDGGQCIAIAADGAVVSDNTIVMSPIAAGAAAEQNGILVIGNNSSINGNRITGYAATAAGIAAGAANEGSAITLRGRHYIDATATPAVDFSLGCSGNSGSANTAIGVGIGVSLLVSDNTLICSDNSICCDCENVTYAVQAYSVFATITNSSFSGKVTGCSAAFLLTNTLRFRGYSTFVSTISDKLFALNNSHETMLENITTDGSAPNKNSVDSVSTITKFDSVFEVLRNNVSQDLRTLAAATIIAEGNTVVGTNGVTSAFTLANGAYAGQQKNINSEFISAGNSIVITGTFAAAKTTLTFNAAGQFARLIWDGSAWLPGAESTVMPV